MITAYRNASIKSKLTLLANSTAVQKTESTTQTDGISLSLDGVRLIFSAVQEASAQNGKATQISLGGVIDGYPLLPKLDPSDDGRFTIRELRDLQRRVNTFDTNEDGEISLSEASSPIRVCIGLGATVHRELAAVRTSSTTSESEHQRGPEWFTRMDRNKDNDLSRDEFSGNDEQFKSLDADADDLISAAEAIAFEKQTAEPSPQ